MEEAGYEVSRQPFQFYAYKEARPLGARSRSSPNQVTYVEDDGLRAHLPVGAGRRHRYRHAGRPRALGLGNASTSGCEAGDWAGFPVGNIALIQRGGCTFEIKGENAAAAGAVRHPVLQPGRHRGRRLGMGIPAVTLGNGYTGGIPALNLTYALGVAARRTSRACEMRLFANVEPHRVRRPRT